MESNQLPIEEYFRYHPPQSSERQAKYDAINEAALNFAKAIDNTVVDEDCKKMAIFAVQQASMFSNQGITVDDLKNRVDQQPQGADGLPK